jgi:type IV pilus assembly protein PilC
LAHADRQARWARQIRSALGYPLIVLGLGVAVIAGVMAWVLPVFQGLYASLQSPLPASTQALLLTRQWLSSCLVPGLATGGAWVLWVAWARRRAAWRLRLERWTWRLPLWGRWRQMQAEAQWCALLARLIGAGLDWQGALALVGPATGSELMAQATLDVRQSLTRGVSLTHTLAAANQRWSPGCGRAVFSPALLQWVRAGEASGTLPDVLQRWGQWQADALADQWSTATRLIEPLLMGGLGLLMAWLVLALYMPVLQMGQLL